MRIKKICIKNYLPIKNFEIDELDDIVLIAGANGVGKTRLIQAIIGYLRNPNTNPNYSIEIEATSKTEQTDWGNKTLLNLSDNQDQRYFNSTLQHNRKRRNFKSSLLCYESNRQITKVQPLAFTWEYADPWEEDIGWDFSFSPFQNRFQDTLHSLFRKVQNQKTSIANKAIQLKEEGNTSMPLSFSDPLEPFKESFYQLLSPKKLQGLNIQNNSLLIKDGENTITENNLSSGEREVLNIIFDFLLRDPSDCIIFFDEPELHLHPELANKLLNTLKTIGKNNQFIFCTHSAELISSNLDNSIVFVQPFNNDTDNQAVLISLENQTYNALKAIGQSIGVVSLGKKIVLVEGTTASLDKKTYLQILKGRFPNLVLVPCEGKYTIQSFSNIANNVLNKTVWGVDFFLLCDRDAYPAEIREKINKKELQDKIKSLDKYHLENYFLDENIIAAIFKEMEKEDSWLCDPEKIKNELVKIAQQRISYSVSLAVSKLFRDIIGNIDIMPSNCSNLIVQDLESKFDETINSELERISDSLTKDSIIPTIKKYYKDFEDSLSNDEWKANIPGKQILSIFTSKAKIGEDRFKTLYIKKAFESTDNPFKDIIEIFKGFSENNI
ncbi:MAG: AAA family ATPase [Ignavibacteriales bacterium]|nr:AAA family ATPase [Ignavibacteriales bacterium]